MVTDLADVAEEGLFLARGARPIELYWHPAAMLRASVVDQSDTVILIGTGSGKTETIYLPVLAALVRESLGWRSEALRVGNERDRTGSPRGSQAVTNNT